MPKDSTTTINPLIIRNLFTLLKSSKTGYSMLIKLPWVAGEGRERDMFLFVKKNSSSCTRRDLIGGTFCSLHIFQLYVAL